MLPVMLCKAQIFDSTLQNLKELPEKYFSKVEDKISSIDDKLTKQTEKYLKKLQKQEDKIRSTSAKLIPLRHQHL